MAQQGWQVGDQLNVELPDASRHDLVVAGLFEGGIATDWLITPTAVEEHVCAPYRDAYVRVAGGADADAVHAQPHTPTNVGPCR